MFGRMELELGLRVMGQSTVAYFAILLISQRSINVRVFGGILSAFLKTKLLAPKLLETFTPHTRTRALLWSMTASYEIGFGDLTRLASLF